MFSKSIATLTLGGSLLDKLDHIRHAGFHGIELFENDLLGFPGTPAEIAKHVADLGLRIDLYQPVRDIEGASAIEFESNLKRLCAKMDLAQRLGTDMVLVCSNVQETVIADDEVTVQQLYRMACEAGKRGMRIGYEALSWARHVNTLDHAWRLIDAIDHPNLGLVVDSFHSLILPTGWSCLEDIPAERIFFAQLADAHLIGASPLACSRHYRCFPGQGDLNVTGFAKKLAESGYNGPLSLEIYSDALKSAPADQTAIDAMRALICLEHELDGVRIKRSLPARASARGNVVPFIAGTPSAVDVHEVAFLELNAQADDMGALNQVLEAVASPLPAGRNLAAARGFKFGCAHISVKTPSQRDDLTVDHRSGPSISTIGFRVADAEKAYLRALSFGYSADDIPIGENAKTHRAITIENGIQLYFTEQPAVDRPPGQTPVNQSPVLGIDHLGFVAPNTEMSRWLLFCKAVLGFKRGDHWLLSDPNGLVREYTMTAPDNAVSFTFTTSQAHLTNTARNVAHYRGSSADHIAIATTDIFGTAKRLRNSNVSLLPISPNYYEDLAVRCNLGDDLLGKLIDNNILYDFDRDGVFLQLFTLPCENRLSVEFVQRINNYIGHGSMNAPIRLAALAQLPHAQQPLPDNGQIYTTLR